MRWPPSSQHRTLSRPAWCAGKAPSAGSVTRRSGGRCAMTPSRANGPRRLAHCARSWSGHSAISRFSTIECASPTKASILPSFKPQYVKSVRAKPRSTSHNTSTPPSHPSKANRLQNLDLRLDVDGERRQDGSTGLMIFRISEIVSYLSSFLTLEPGDIPYRAVARARFSIRVARRGCWRSERTA
ncbi:hypothetical protein CHELA1G11_20685 [Hyphomicrobiales bacterium]|nr:hypothetical protein CHELA1G11_20685 [Hyphomicrobiales bacterium]